MLAHPASSVSGDASLVSLPTGVGETQTLNTRAMQETWTMGFMPDGMAIYFAGNDGHGWRMYSEDVAGAAPRSMTPLISVKATHLESHVLSPDGKFFFARDSSGRGGLYPIAGGEPRTIPGWQPEDIWVTWSGDGGSAYVYHDEKNSAPVYRLDLHTGKRELVATLAPSDPAGVTAIICVRMTADGKAYAYSFSRELSDLFLVEGVH